MRKQIPSTSKHLKTDIRKYTDDTLTCENSQDSDNLPCMSKYLELQKEKNIKSFDQIYDALSIWDELCSWLNRIGLESCLNKLIDSYLNKQYDFVLDCKHEFIVNDLIFRIFKVKNEAGDSYYIHDVSAQENLINLLRILDLLYSIEELQYLQNHYVIDIHDMTKTKIIEKWTLFKTICNIANFQYNIENIINSIKENFLLTNISEQINFYLYNYTQQKKYLSNDLVAMIDLIFDTLESITASNYLPPNNLQYNYIYTEDKVMGMNLYTSEVEIYDEIMNDVQGNDQYNETSINEVNNTLKEKKAVDERNTVTVKQEVIEEKQQQIQIEKDTLEEKQGHISVKQEPIEVKTEPHHSQETVRVKSEEINTDISAVTVKPEPIDNEPVVPAGIKVKIETPTIAKQATDVDRTQNNDDLYESDHYSVVSYSDVESVETELFSTDNNTVCSDIDIIDVDNFDYSTDENYERQIIEGEIESIKSRFRRILTDIPSDSPKYHQYCTETLDRMTILGEEKIHNYIKFGLAKIKYTPKPEIILMPNHNMKYRSYSKALICPYCIGYHTIKNCPIKYADREYDSRCCNNCGDFAHISKKCPYKKILYLLRSINRHSDTFENYVKLRNLLNKLN